MDAILSSHPRQQVNLKEHPRLADLCRRHLARTGQVIQRVSADEQQGCRLRHVQCVHMTPMSMSTSRSAFDKKV